MAIGYDYLMCGCLNALDKDHLHFSRPAIYFLLVDLALRHFEIAEIFGIPPELAHQNSCLHNPSCRAFSYSQASRKAYVDKFGDERQMLQSTELVTAEDVMKQVEEHGSWANES